MSQHSGARLPEGYMLSHLRTFWLCSCYIIFNLLRFATTLSSKGTLFQVDCFSRNTPFSSTQRESLNFSRSSLPLSTQEGRFPSKALEMSTTQFSNLDQLKGMCFLPQTTSLWSANANHVCKVLILLSVH